jgi:hypothetical protein
MRVRGDSGPPADIERYRLTSAWSSRHNAVGKESDTWIEHFGFGRGLAVPLLKPGVMRIVGRCSSMEPWAGGLD